jgi:tripartite ATP-independent transporter DctM subunit
MRVMKKICNGINKISEFVGRAVSFLIAAMIMGTVLAACVGVIAASVIMIGLIAIPTMLNRGYNRELICGSVSAGGCLGILIPPSMMLIVYGPMAGISVGKLFMGAFGPGLMLSAIYMIYIAIRCRITPELAPPATIEERSIPLGKKLFALLTGMLPPLFLMFSVLGVIFFGIAAPTEAAAIGAVAATLLGVANRRLDWPVLRDSLKETMQITAMVMFIGWGANIFTGVFLRNGGGEVVANMILATPFGKWGAFAIVMFLVFILGFVMDWIGITFILVPILSPIVPELGFDPLWFALMICVNLQMSFMTPPMAPAMFYLRGIIKPEWNINTNYIIRGAIPFVMLIVLGLIICIIFPDIIMWLPHQMIKF